MKKDFFDENLYNESEKPENVRGRKRERENSIYKNLVWRQVTVDFVHGILRRERDGALCE